MKIKTLFTGNLLPEQLLLEVRANKVLLSLRNWHVLYFSLRIN